MKIHSGSKHLMRVLENNLALTQLCRDAPRALGLVPTMGALHPGHIALVRRARQENKTLAVSIFVNPPQFGAGEDLAQYPSNLDRDLALLRHEEVDIVFAPPVEEMYPPGFDTWVNVGGLSDKQEGVHRPGHFRGVTTVVSQLCNLFRPDRVYFGQKDGQQVAVIRRLLRDLHWDLEMTVVPTVREPDGLAYSSRNKYLSHELRRAAPIIFQALCRAKMLWRAGERDADKLRRKVLEVLQQEPLVGNIDYINVTDPDSLDELKRVSGRAMVSTALHLGKIRLIDNIILE